MTQPNDHPPLHAAIYQALGSIAAASPSPPSWQEAWLNLPPAATDEERLAVYRAVRVAGSVPADAGFFMVAWLIDLLTDERAEQGLLAHEQRLKEIRQRHGVDEDTPASEDTPPEYREAMRQMQDAWDDLYLATLEEFGEHELAQLFRDDEDEFYDRYEAGRQFFHGANGDDEDEDTWLDAFLDNVAACIQADSPMGPLGLRYTHEEDFWEVTIHPTPVKLLGGRHDGEPVVPGFSLDLAQFQALFDGVEDFGWNSIGRSGKPVLGIVGVRPLVANGFENEVMHEHVHGAAEIDNFHAPPSGHQIPHGSSEEERTRGTDRDPGAT